MASLLGKFTFSYLNPLLETGRRRGRLDVHDLPKIEPEVTAQYATQTLEGAWEASAAEKRPGMRFAKMIWARYRGLLCSVLGLRVCSDVLSFSSPIVMESIIGWLGDQYQRAPWWEPAGLPVRARGLYYVLVMAVTSLGQTFLQLHTRKVSERMASQVRTFAVVQLYQKSLRQKIHVRAQVTSGKVVNLMSSDSHRMLMAVPIFHVIPCAIFKVALGIRLLLRQLGAGPVITGVLVIIGFMPLSFLGINYIDHFLDKTAELRDRRLSQMGELLGAIKLIKSSGWESRESPAPLPPARLRMHAASFRSIISVVSDQTPPPLLR